MIKKYILIILCAIIGLSNLHAMNQSRNWQWWAPRDYLKEEAEAIKRQKESEERLGLGRGWISALPRRKQALKEAIAQERAWRKAPYDPYAGPESYYYLLPNINRARYIGKLKKEEEKLERSIRNLRSFRNPAIERDLFRTQKALREAESAQRASRWEQFKQRWFTRP